MASNSFDKKDLFLSFGLVVCVIAFSIPSLINIGLQSPIGADTYYHIKFVNAIIGTQKVVSSNPYFSGHSLVYPLGAHIVFADFAILSGVSVPTLFALSPLMIGMIIVFTFYAFAMRFLNKYYAFVATIVFYPASTNPTLYIATNGAQISNSLGFPYISVLIGVVLFYIFLLSLTLEGHSTYIRILLGVVLALLVYTFQLLALGAIIILMAYGFFSKSVRVKDFVLIVGVAVVSSSFYWSNLIATGLPTQTTSFDTYARFGFLNYFDEFGLAISLLVIIGVSLLLTGVVKTNRSSIIDRKWILLFSFVCSFIVASQAWRIGIILVNDLFVYFAIGGIAIMSIHVLEHICNWFTKNDLKKVAAILILATVLIGPGMSFLAVNQGSLGGNQSVFYSHAASWLAENGAGKGFASDASAQYYIASVTNAIPVALPPTYSVDYYATDADMRAQALNDIYGSSVISSLNALTEYNVSVLLNIWPWPLDSIFGTQYVNPVFPAQPCFHGGMNYADLDGDGIPESYLTFVGQSTRSYLIANMNKSDILTLNYMFSPNSRGPVQVFVNGTRVYSLTNNNNTADYQWTTGYITLPNNVVSRFENVRLINFDPTNAWYLGYIGAAQISSCNDLSNGNVSIYSFDKVAYSVGQYEPIAFDNQSYYATLPWNGRTYTTLVWSNNSDVSQLKFTGMFDPHGTIGPILTYVNGELAGAIALTNMSLSGKWVEQAVSLSTSIVHVGWNNVTLVNCDKANDWYVSSAAFQSSSQE